MEMDVSLFSLTAFLTWINSILGAYKGIKMCENECRQTGGCTGINFDLVQLECRLIFDRKNAVVAMPPVVYKMVTQVCFVGIINF